MAKLQGRRPRPHLHPRRADPTPRPVLGVDRDSELVAFDFDERDEGVVEMIRQAVAGAHRNGRHIGICGQGPSDFPDLARRLVEFGIDSISLNPDTIVRTRTSVAKVEAELAVVTG